MSATLPLGRGREPSNTDTHPSQTNVQELAPGKGRADLRQNFQCIRTRPASAEASKQGSSGRVVNLSANYFKMICKPKFEFCLYRVDFEPEIEMDKMRRAFVSSQKEFLGGYLYDGRNMIYLTKRLTLNHQEFEIKSKENVNYNMIIKWTGVSVKPTDQAVTQIWNLILRRMMNQLELEFVGRNLFDPKNKIRLDEFRVELWPGYVTSIRQHEEDVLVCCEISHKVMRIETIYDLLRQYGREHSRDQDWQDSFKREIIGSIVLTDYNNKTYRVDNVDFNSSPNSTFMKKGVETSYNDYYKQRYNITIRDPNQPMLVSNPKPRDIRAGRLEVLFLVPELSRATGLSDKMRANFQMMRGLAQHTQMNPDNRKMRLQEFCRRLHNAKDPNNQFKAFGVDIDSKLVSFQGRALKQETIIFGQGRTAENDDRVDWTNQMKSNDMFQTVPLTRWAIICPKKAEQETQTFLRLLREVAAGMHYEMGEPRMFQIYDDKTSSYAAQLEQVASKDPRLILIVVPNNAADRYAVIKRTTCVNVAIPTQVICSKTMLPKKGGMGGVKSIATKVMIQINCKLGGAPWMVKFPLRGVMAIGFDVSHDSRDRSKSFGAFVATMDLKENVNFYSAVSSHKDGEEISGNIEHHLVGALRAFKNMHGALPERIFFYRDGVGEGQIEYVVTQETKRVEMRLKAIYARVGDGKEPRLSFIIVNKRINTRIFLNKHSQFDNPVSGTVVDSVITLPERQSVRQGTVAPTSYNIIHDTSGLTPDQLQMITYKYTHLYYNWSGTTRVPAVVQYAHKLAELVSQHLHQSPMAGFNGQLYFL